MYTPTQALCDEFEFLNYIFVFFYIYIYMCAVAERSGWDLTDRPLAPIWKCEPGNHAGVRESWNLETLDPKKTKKIKLYSK